MASLDTMLFNGSGSGFKDSVDKFPIRLLKMRNSRCGGTDESVEKFDVVEYTDTRSSFQKRIGIRMGINSNVTADDEVVQIEVIIVSTEGGKG